MSLCGLAVMSYFLSKPVFLLGAALSFFNHILWIFFSFFFSFFLVVCCKLSLLLWFLSFGVWKSVCVEYLMKKGQNFMEKCLSI